MHVQCTLNNVSLARDTKITGACYVTTTIREQRPFNKTTSERVQDPVKVDCVIVFTSETINVSHQPENN